MGGTSRTFFSDSSDGDDKGVKQEGIEALIDVFCSEYGWLLLYVVGHTLFQLKNLKIAIDRRIYDETKRVGDTIRAANDTRRDHYSRYLKMINPDYEERQKGKKGSKKGRKKVQEIDNLPTGFIYVKMG